MVSIGVDIGGSHISSVAVHSETGKIYADSFNESRINNNAGASVILKAWSSSIQKTIDTIDSNELSGIGIAMPGPFDYKNGISAIYGVSKYNRLMGLDIRHGLHTHLNLPENISINFINDAFAFGIGEAWQGNGKNINRLVAITLGTGFGSAFLHNGVPVVKGNTVPKYGYIYHVPFKNSISEEYISTRWFLARYKAITGFEINGVKEITKEAFSHTGIEELFKEFGENLAMILGPWLQKFETEMLVIGGNISGASDLFLPFFYENLKTQHNTIEVRISRLKEKATFFGCSRLGDSHFYKQIEKNLY